MSTSYYDTITDVKYTFVNSDALATISNTVISVSDVNAIPSEEKQPWHGVKDGRLLWDSFHKGTYVKSKHGEI